MAVMDLEAFEERAAIMEYDGGLSRFAAETAAAKAQGRKRHEFTNQLRHLAAARDQDAGAPRDAADDLPRVQPNAAQEARSLPVGDVQGGRDTGVLLALRLEDGRVL